VVEGNFIETSVGWRLLAAFVAAMLLALMVAWAVA